ncbi:MAG: endonuclease/exonuclease/phosphatase family protein [Ottowia sp.]|nr:endonuclease/exonuclease/phosphatase family protein [Ottowia sp.]
MNPITIAAASDRGASLPRAERWRRALMRRLAWLTGLALVAGTLPAWQDRVPGETLRWMADLAVHWQWLYAAAGAAAGLVWLLLARGRGRAWAAALLLGLAVVAALNLTRWSLPRLPAANGAAGAPALRLLSFNVNLDNHRTADVLDWLDTQQADVLALLEVTPDMDGLLQALRARYPHAVLQPQHDAFGMAVFSRYPLVPSPAAGGAAPPHHWAARVMAPQGAFGLQVIHPMSPISSAEHAARDALLAALAQPATSSPAEPQVVMGDFNTTPWSAALQRLGDDGWARATGLAPTFRLLRSLPIDHVLATRAHWRVAASGTGPWLGSDHRPVWAVLQRVP